MRRSITPRLVRRVSPCRCSSAGISPGDDLKTTLRRDMKPQPAIRAADYQPVIPDPPRTPSRGPLSGCRIPTLPLTNYG